MNSQRFVSCAFSVLATAISAAFAPTVAAAPTQAAATANDSAHAQTAPAAAADEADKKKVAQLGAVTVTGIKDSLKSAQTIKQDNRMVVDSIVAEDIGKLPDDNVADALARIPGVQTSRNEGTSETGTVVIRGLPNAVTTLNGLELFSSDGRGYSFENLPATAVSGLDVYKSTEASMVAGGIAGTVDIRTFRPFDFDGFRAAATFTDTNAQHAAHTDPTASLLLSNRWDTDAGKFGALVNFGITTQHYDAGQSVLDDDNLKIATHGGPKGTGSAYRTSHGDLLAVPNQYGVVNEAGYRKRPEFNYALQWKPNANTELYVEGLYDWESGTTNQQYFYVLPNQYNTGANIVAPSNVAVGSTCFPVAKPGSPYLGQTACAPQSASYSGNFFGLTSTHPGENRGHDISNTADFKWHSGDLRLSGSVSRTASSYYKTYFGYDMVLKPPFTLDYSQPYHWGVTGHAGQTDVFNPSNYYFGNYFNTWNDNAAKQTAWRADGSLSMGGGFFSSLDFGIRYSDKDVSSRASADFHADAPGFALNADGSPVLSSVNNVVAVFGPKFFCRMHSSPAVPNPLLTACYDQQAANVSGIRSYFGLPSGLPPASPGGFFAIGEKNTAAYAQTDYGGELFGLPFDGVLGMRMEKIKRNLSAFDYDTSADLYTPNTQSTSQTAWLPNASFILHLRDNLQLRVVAGKTLSYPSFSQLNPAYALTHPTANLQATGNSGNSKLNPQKSNNYDASLEWYFADASSLTAGLFYKDISGYIESYVVPENIGGVNYQITKPRNAGEGHLAGAEFAYTQFFDFLPRGWNGLGVQANYTLIKSGLATPSTTGDGMVHLPFQNVSRNNYNLVLIYEKYGVSARLAYNYRNAYPWSFTANNILGTNIQSYAKEANFLDLSVAYDFNKYLTGVFTATNLLHNNFTAYVGKSSLPSEIHYEERTFGLGLRMKL